MQAHGNTNDSLTNGTDRNEQRPRSWRRRIVRWRNRLVASRRFQRWAASFPLTRPVARQRASRLFDLCAGFAYSQILYACVRLKLLELVRDEPCSVAQAAQALSLPVDGARRLLAGAAALGLVEPENDGRYGLAMDGAALLGNPGAVAMIAHHPHFYDDMRDPVALLRGEVTDTALSRFWGYAGDDDPSALRPDDTSEYTALMAASQSLIAEDILDGANLSHHRCLMDVGGGDGTFVEAVAAREPNLRLMLFDLPAVAEQAARRIQNAELSERVEIHGGDFFTAPLPTGADAISLVRVLLDHDDARALTILCQTREALPPGGTLLVAETLSGVRGAETVSDAYFGFYLLAMGKGRPRSVAEMRTLLRKAGFREIRLERTRRPLLTQLVTARR